MNYLDYLDKNDTAYLEYHKWRVEEIKVEDDSLSLSHTLQMLCNMCKVVTDRKQQGFPKRTIRSVASWWWVNVHDDLCTKDYEMPSWVKEFPPVTMDNSFDELKVNLKEDRIPKK